MANWSSMLSLDSAKGAAQIPALFLWITKNKKLHNIIIKLFVRMVEIRCVHLKREREMYNYIEHT